MRVRKQTATGDWQFGNGQSDFHVNNPAGVAQRILTRLRLATGEWFLDLLEGTPYDSQILGKHSVVEASAALRFRVINTPDVRSLNNFQASRNAGRRLAVAGDVETSFGTVRLDQTL